MKRFVALCLLALALALGLAATAAAQTWPSRAITIVVPFPPGPGLDMMARLVADKLGPTLGQNVVVENRTGANGTIGSQTVARAAPDGHTILAGTAGTHVTAVHLMKSLPYDPLKDFSPIVAAVEPVTCLAVSSTLPVNSVAELIAYAKARPDELSYGSSGVGSVFHLLGELFNQTAGVRIKHVPYRGVAPAMQDVVGGHIPMTFIAISNALTGGDRVKILAILEPKRYARFPDIPSITEALPAFRKPSTWFGFFGPADMPAPIVSRLNGEIVSALNAPEVRPKLDDNALAIIGGTPEQFAAMMREDIERYGAIIKAAGIQPE
jgi:tripartite-type tricarboxylate transporter receptor subunit TctC